MGKAINTTSCPSCKASGGDWDDNNLVVYADQSVYCFACQYSSRESSKWIKGECQSLEKSRGINEDTCKYYNYKVGKYTGSIGVGKDKRNCEDEWVRIMEWYDDSGKLIMQKIKTQFKEMKLIGDTKCKRLWGRERFQPTDKLFVTVTEGEEDAMSIAQVQGCQFPIVSVGSSTSVVDVLSANIDWLSKFKHVVLAFDNDGPGKQAVNKVLSSELFEPGKVKVVEWPLKDANDMLKAGRQKDMLDCIFRAKIREPEHIVTVNQIINQVLEQPQVGIDYPWSTWNKWTYGLRYNEIITLVGPSGCGKTEVIKDIVSHLLGQMNVGIFSFEQSPSDTIRRYAGAKLGLKLQKPGEKWDAKLIEETAMKFDQRVFLYDFNGKVDIDDIFHSIRFMNKAKGCKWFVIDNLKSLRVVMKKEECAEFATRLKALVKELHIQVMLVSHVNKDGIRQSTHVGFSSKVDKPHAGLNEDAIKDIMNKFKLDWETGRMATTSNIEGGNDIEAISDYVIALARNKQSKDPKIRRTITLKLLKEGRIDSDNDKYTFQLYRNDQGILEEIDDDKELVCDNNDESLPF